MASTKGRHGTYQRHVKGTTSQLPINFLSFLVGIRTVYTRHRIVPVFMVVAVVLWFIVVIVPVPVAVVLWFIVVVAAVAALLSPQ